MLTSLTKVALLSLRFTKLHNSPDGAWKIIEKKLKGKLGDKESELVRNIVVAYLSEKGYFEEEK